MIDGNDPQGTASDDIVDTSDDDATAAIEALLDDPDDLDDDPRATDDDTAEADGQDPDAGSDAGGDEPEADGQDDAEEAPPEQPDLSDVELFLSDGRKVNRKQIEAAFQAERDIRAAYTPKFQELAEGRKALEAEYDGVTQQKQYFDQLIPFAQELIQQSMPQPPSEEDYRRDFVGADAKRRAYERAQQQIGTIQQALEYRQQEAVQQQQHAVVQRKSQMAQALFTRRSDLLTKGKPDPAKFANYEGSIKQTLTAYGFAPDDIQDIQDPRILEIIEDAAKYRELQAARPKAQAKAEGKPPVAAPGARKSGNPVQAKRRDDLKAKLRSSGDGRVAEALLSGLDL